ncbi:MAG: hypothetical protein ACFB13_06430 [Kiloniellaceae bacterium]
MIAGAATAALMLSGTMLSAPAMAAGQMEHKESEAATQPAGKAEQVSMEQRCERLSQRYIDSAVTGGADANVLGAEVLHEEGTAACEAGNYRQGIAKIQEALAEIGGADQTPTGQSEIEGGMN